MKVLVIGSGGREHALCWKIAQSPRVTALFCAPGSPGISGVAKTVPIPAHSISELASFAEKEGVGLTVVGPELPLVNGIADEFERRGLRIFGPLKRAAALEASKAFAKRFMTKYRIPTAGYAIFTDCIEAKDYLDGRKYPVVVKADGLAAGKGVVICKSRGEADAAVDMMLKRKKYGGDAIVIEDFLAGEEASFIVITDGETICPLPTSQDHKAVYDGDEGPNTGGMGAYSPAPVVNDALQQKIISEIVMPTIEGMKTEGRKFSGFLYAGLMISEGRPYVLEYNVRCGDPEAQPIMMRLSSDLVPIIEAAAGGTLGEANAEWDRRPAVSVVMASKGYPGNYEKGMAIKGIEEASALEGVAVFHSGTKRDNGNWLTDGGRVLSVTTVGENLQRAIANAYEAVGKITWSGAHYRKDIGKKALKYVAEGQMALL